MRDVNDKKFNAIKYAIAILTKPLDSIPIE